jgi:hypothetical protein
MINMAHKNMPGKQWVRRRKRYTPLLESARWEKRGSTLEMPFLLKDVMEEKKRGNDVFSDEPSADIRWQAFAEIAQIAQTNIFTARTAVPTLMINYEKFGIITKCMALEAIDEILTGFETKNDIRNMFGRRLHLVMDDANHENKELRKRVECIMEKLASALYGSGAATPVPTTTSSGASMI